MLITSSGGQFNKEFTFMSQSTLNCKFRSRRKQSKTGNRLTWDAVGHLHAGRVLGVVLGVHVESCHEKQKLFDLKVTAVSHCYGTIAGLRDTLVPTSHT
jgi:hypothetical protein